MLSAQLHTYEQDTESEEKDECLKQVKRQNRGQSPKIEKVGRHFIVVMRNLLDHSSHKRSLNVAGRASQTAFWEFSSLQVLG
jgi:hypothetical protein